MASPYQQQIGSQMPHMVGSQLPNQPQGFTTPQGLVMPSMGGTTTPTSIMNGVNTDAPMPDPTLVGAQGPGGMVGPGMVGTTSQSSQHSKDFNTAMMCRIGQETVQEIVSKTIELFQNLKALQPPNGTSQSLAGQEERRTKLNETLRNIGMLFKRLRRVHEICNENCAGMEYTHIEPDVTLQSLVPMKDELDSKQEDKKPSEAMKCLLEERCKLTEQVTTKNRQLKDVIDNLRNIIWEINTMLAMRKRHLQFTERISSLPPSVLKQKAMLGPSMY